ncbi:hypothetical protein [Streptomyces sp. NRRL B-24484]|uniref:hypothetical protein n=1 Tax=Streptomyces sp. NRRL B-24484 TaxID=1463833 RepID=UPI0004C0C79A|nr:hypothetical protein [Streptomyces sp. NRRL B-24484]
MAKQTTGKMTKLRRGTQELLERRGMASNPGPLAPQLHTDTASAARSGPYFGDAMFSHGGRRTSTTAGPMAGVAHHVELPGHRHRGAEKHSAH